MSEYKIIWKLSPQSPEKPDDYKGVWKPHKQTLYYFCDPKNIETTNKVIKFLIYKLKLKFLKRKYKIVPEWNLAWSDSVIGAGYVIFQKFDYDTLGTIDNWNDIDWTLIDCHAWEMLQCSMIGVDLSKSYFSKQITRAKEFSICNGLKENELWRIQNNKDKREKLYD